MRNSQESMQHAQQVLKPYRPLPDERTNSGAAGRKRAPRRLRRPAAAPGRSPGAHSHTPAALAPLRAHRASSLPGHGGSVQGGSHAQSGTTWSALAYGIVQPTSLARWRKRTCLHACSRSAGMCTGTQLVCAPFARLASKLVMQIAPKVKGEAALDARPTYRVRAHEDTSSLCSLRTSTLDS